MEYRALVESSRCVRPPCRIECGPARCRPASPRSWFGPHDFL